MRKIPAKAVTKLVKELFLKANYELPTDIQKALQKSIQTEKKALAKEILGQVVENSKIAKKGDFPLCQDTGLAVCLVKIGQEVQICGADLNLAINKGVKQAYEIGFLRKSIVQDPLRRKNTQDNTPAIIHYEIVPGDKLKVAVMPKGFGSENMSRLTMLTPAEGLTGIQNFILKTIQKAGAKGCPPYVVGVGIGGNFEKVALMAKEALFIPLDQKNPDPFWAKQEIELFKKINNLKIGPQGLGGKTTCLGVHIKTFATHVAGLPIAVNLCCHADRRASGKL